jgi:hypothetical protein
MTLTLDATAGGPSANAYIDVAGADAYFEARLQDATWLGASPTDKAAALVWATRILDTRIRWSGLRSTTTQALDWPRSYVRDPNSMRAVAEAFPDSVMYVSSTIIPQDLKDACCELALDLLSKDRTLDPSSKGLRSLKVGSIEKVFDGASTPVLPRPVRDLMRVYGTFDGGPTSRLVRG